MAGRLIDKFEMLSEMERRMAEAERRDVCWSDSFYRECIEYVRIAEVCTDPTRPLARLHDRPVSLTHFPCTGAM